MPDLDGFGVAEKLRELHDGLFDLVFVSGGNQPDLPEKAARYGSRFVEKPFDPIEFGVARLRRRAEEQAVSSSYLRSHEIAGGQAKFGSKSSSLGEPDRGQHRASSGWQ